jgi:hypothetical protein
MQKTQYLNNPEAKQARIALNRIIVGQNKHRPLTDEEALRACFPE